MTGKVGVSGAWKDMTPSGFKVGVGGAWKTVDKAWVGVGGAWKEWYVNISAAIPSSFGMPDVNPPNSAELAFTSAGAYSAVSNGVTRASGTWIGGGTGADYEIKLTKTGGGLTASGTVGSWLALSSTRTWTWSSSGVDDSWDGTVEIRNATTLEVLDSATVSVTFSSGV